MLDADIVHKSTLFLHEQLFCDVQDYFLLLIHTDIAHKDTLYLHE